MHRDRRERKHEKRLHRGGVTSRGNLLSRARRHVAKSLIEVRRVKPRVKPCSKNKKVNAIEAKERRKRKVLKSVENERVSE